MNKSGCGPRGVRARSNRIVTHLVLSVGAAALLPGCLLMSAATDPYSNNLFEVQPGTERSTVIAVHGEPESASYKEGKEVDVYECDPTGPKLGERGEIVAGILVLDAATMGLMEIAAASLGPFEMAIDGRMPYLLYTVSYTPANKVESVVVSKEKSKWMPAPLS
jgi:hypothetical protein